MTPHVQVRSYYSLEVKSGIRGKNSIMPKKHECTWIQSRNKSDEPERISEWRHWCFHRTRNVKGSDFSEIQNVSALSALRRLRYKKNENCHFFSKATLSNISSCLIGLQNQLRQVWYVSEFNQELERKENSHGCLQLEWYMQLIHTTFLIGIKYWNACGSTLVAWGWRRMQLT